MLPLKHPQCTIVIGILLNSWSMRTYHMVDTCLAMSSQVACFPMASHVSLQVARLEEKIPFLQSRSPLACEECFSGMFLGWRCLWSDHVPKALQPWLSKYKQLLHEDSRHGGTSLPMVSKLAAFMVDRSLRVFPKRVFSVG